MTPKQSKQMYWWGRGFHDYAQEIPPAVRPEDLPDENIADYEQGMLNGGCEFQFHATNYFMQIASEEG